ncbi:MAG: LPXTG cell wall anchor domain-containing protein, partial [Gemmataceae bacterium]
MPPVATDPETLTRPIPTRPAGDSPDEPTIFRIGELIGGRNCFSKRSCPGLPRTSMASNWSLTALGISLITGGSTWFSRARSTWKS